MFKFLAKLIVSIAGLLAAAYACYLIMALWISEGEFFAALAAIGVCMIIYAVFCIWD